MEASSYERGAGGKFRKRPARKPSTPYDRPLMETKSTGPLAHSQEKRNGWLSRIMDPASRIITSSATRFFASMFQKRLTAPAHHNPSDVKLEAVHKGHVQELENPSGCTNKKFDGQEESATENSLCSRLHELEQMLKDKTLSRDDFNRLTEILQTRMVDSRSNGESKKVQFNTSKTAVACVAADDKNNSMHGYVKSLVADTEAASPAEVAKAFMGSRVARISPGNSALRRPTFTNLALSTPQAQSLSVLKRINKTYGVSGAKVYDIFSPQSQGGRSVPYSPAAPASAYLRFASDADCEAKNDEYVGISESQWAHDAPNSSRQALKRRSSVLDNDIGSISSIRRIRQKSNLLPAFKGFGLLAGPTLPSSSDAVQSSLPSSQKSVQFSLPKYKFPAKSLVANGVNQTMPANFASVPRQSSERARQILEELDKINPLPLPKEKSPELKLAFARENSPAKLTCNMLRGKALRTMEDVDITKSSNQHGITLDCSNTSRKWNHNERKDKVEENELTENPANAITESKDGGLTKESSILPGALPDLKNGDSDSVRHPREAWPFQMIAPEMDEDGYSVEEISAASLALKEKEEPATETASLQKSLIHPPGGKPARLPSLITATSVDNSSDFNFTPSSNSISESPSVLAKSSPLYGSIVETGHAGEKGSLVSLSTADSSVVNSSSKNASDGTNAEYSDTAVLKMATLIQQRNSGPDKEVKPWKVEGTVMSSAFATSSPSGNFGFGTSSPPSSSNGLANESSASRAFYSQAASVLPSALHSTLSSHLTPISGSLGFQFGAGNSPPLAANLVPSSSKPQVTPIVSEKPLPVGNIGSASIPTSSAPASGTSFTATAASTQVDSSSLAASSSLGNQLTEAGAGSATSLTVNPPSHLSSSTPSPTSGLSVASTFGAVSSPFGSSIVAVPVIGSSSSLTTIDSFDTGIQKTSASSSVLVKPLGTECSSLFSSGFSSSFSGMGGLSFGASSSGATAATSTFSFGGSAAGAASTTVGFSFGGSSTNLTASSASTGFSFTGLSSSSASSPSTTGVFPCATASSTASSPTGFSFGGSSVGASASSSSSTGFAFGGSSVGGTASSSTAGFSFGVLSVGANASSSSTTGFSFGLSSVGASGSSSNAGFSFGGSAGASTLSSVTGFSFGGSSGSSTDSSTITSFSTVPALAAVSSTATGFSFGLSSAASSPTPIGFSFGPGTSSSATTTAFSFGTSSSLNNSPFLFGSSAGTSASTGSLFSFTASTSSTTPSIGFTSKTGSTFPPQSTVMFGSATNDQMNVEDSMAEDIFQASAPVTPAVTPAFAMNSTPSSNFKFGSPNVPTVGQPVFSFGAPQGLPSSQAPSPFAAGGSLEFAGGSFSLGTNGGDKSGRKIVRVKRDKVRKK